MPQSLIWTHRSLKVHTNAFYVKSGHQITKEEDPKIPHFKSDGKTFSLNITDKRTKSGSVEENGEGTLSLDACEEKTILYF